MSICSGIGAPEQAAPWIDWRYQSEIEPFPSAVLAERFPDAVNLGDMTKFKEWPDADVDVLVGGTPCQSFSVAGLRKGLDDPRGNLMLTFLAIAARYAPRWIVWENVPGVLSSNGGRDFGTFLGALGQLGYGWAYRVLDAQHVRTPRFPHAVPQRRRRVFVVGYLGDWRRAAAILFEPEGLRGHPPPRREAGQVPAALTANGVGACGPDDNQAQAGHLIASTEDAANGHLIPQGGGWPADVAATLNTAFGDKMGLEDQHALNGASLFVPDTMTAHTLRGEGFDASEDGSGRGTPLAPVAYSIMSMNSGKDYKARATATTYAVRRLTPVECERLQGMPDLWTQIPWRGKPADQCPDGPRHKAIGNSWAVNCGEFIFDRIKAVEEMAAE